MEALPLRPQGVPDELGSARLGLATPAHRPPGCRHVMDCIGASTLRCAVDNPDQLHRLVEAWH
jgi:hypothetical protein